MKGGRINEGALEACMQSIGNFLRDEVNQTRILFLVFVAGIIVVFWSFFASIMTPFLVGGILAYLFRPVMKRLIHFGLSPVISALVLMFLVYALIIGILFLLLPSLKKLLLFLTHHAPAYSEKLIEKIAPFLGLFWKDPKDHIALTTKLYEGLGQSFSNVISWGTRALLGIWDNGVSLMTFFFVLLFSPFIGFYLLKDQPEMSKNLRGLIPDWLWSPCHQLIQEMDILLSLYIRGQSIVCAIAASYYGVSLSFVPISFGAVIGMMTGIFVFVPCVGFLTGFVSAMLIGLLEGAETGTFIAIAGIYVGGYVLENFLLTPYFIGRKIGLHPLLVLFVIFAGGALKGLVGVFLALPTSTLVIAFWRFIKPYYKRSIFFNQTKSNSNSNSIKVRE